MANAAADHSDTSGRVLSLGRVDQLRVRVAYGRKLDGPSHHVFLLDVPLAGVEEAFDEMPYLEALEPILYAGAGAPREYSVHLNRHHTSVGAVAGRVEIGMDLTTGGRTSTLSTPALDAVTLAFRSVLDRAGGSEHLELRHDDAIVRARVQVHEAYPELNPDELSVSDEEHRAAQGSWSVGLRTSDLNRYVVVVGFLDGYPGSAHILHEPRSEVLDSVGSEVP
ncbi:MAG: hypothetical protein JWO11_4402 [Nocardioides sp.]|nr:hypothetical protein [Nocardioides sp.]